MDIVRMVRCSRCNGTGVYTWGAYVNGKPTHSGQCYKCVGGGQYPATMSAVREREWRERQQRRNK